MTNNPNGRPIGSKNISTILREKLQELAPDASVDNDFIREFAKGQKVITNGHAIACRLLDEAINKGELPAIKEVFDRTEGKAAQSIEVKTDNDLQSLANRLAHILVTKHGFTPEKAAKTVATEYNLPTDQIVIESVQ
jgi:hypothetical protein